MKKNKHIKTPVLDQHGIAKKLKHLKTLKLTRDIHFHFDQQHWHNLENKTCDDRHLALLEDLLVTADGLHAFYLGKLSNHPSV